VADILPFLEKLALMAHSGGGWGYTAGLPAHLEPTCLGILALQSMPDPFGHVLASAHDFLQGQKSTDGSYRRNRDPEAAVWPTALVLFVQATTGQPASVIDKTANRLLAIKGRLRDDGKAAEIHDFNVRIDGWPWAEGNFSWVEPTAWACLALSKAGYADHPRVQQGQELLLDRAFDEGGINYGNRTVLGRRLDPIPGPTALMLLALQNRACEPRVLAAIRYLSGAALVGEDLQHLCWAKLALDCYRDRSEVAETLNSLDGRIVAAYQRRVGKRWLTAGPMPEALAALSLADDGRNLFSLKESPARQSAWNGGTLELWTPPATHPKSWGQRFMSGFRGLAVNALGHLRQLPPQTQVHIAKTANYDEDLSSILEKQYAGFRERIPLKGKKVVLKPNIVEYHRDKVINTHPKVVGAVIELCKREGAAEILVAEGPGHWRNVEFLVQESGLGDVLRHHDVQFIDLNHDEPVKAPNLGRLTGLEYLYFAKTVIDADVFVSLPKLKTHHWTGATLSLKNLFGTLPGICYGWPKNELHWRGIENSIVDIAVSRPPDLQIVDGIIGMQGDGPLNGGAKKMGVLVMGVDPVAVDATCCRLMHIDPQEVGHLLLAYQSKVGLLPSKQIQQIGESIAEVAQPFELAPHFAGAKTVQSA
jgi:uncharacterized protein (DUF362 family)